VNTTEYISSGILEAYAIGDLSMAERAEVERNLKLYPALQAELARIEETNEKLLMKLSVSPPAIVKSRILQKSHNRKDNIRSIGSTNIGFWKYAAAASISVALIAGVLALNYRNKWRAAESNYSDLLAQNQRIAQDYNQVNERLDKIENDILIFENPDFKKIVLSGTPNAPQAMASVYWNEKTREVYLSLQNMKALSTQNQYQLWAIIDGKPVDAGVFDANISGLLKMKEIAAGATTFAVTIEPRGGKRSPSLETMQVAGNVIRG
jgi:anti-sigma-K factor RskA